MTPRRSSTPLAAARRRRPQPPPKTSSAATPPSGSRRWSSERAFAFRRLNLMRAVADAVARRRERGDRGRGRARAVLRSKLGWSSDSEARDAVLRAFRAGRAGDVRRACAPNDGRRRPDVAAALADFETWYADDPRRPVLGAVRALHAGDARCRLLSRRARHRVRPLDRRGVRERRRLHRARRAGRDRRHARSRRCARPIST